MANPNFVNALQNVIGMTANQANVVTNNGINSIDDLTYINDDFALSMQTGNLKLNVMVKTRFEALLRWVYDSERQREDGNNLDINDFTQEICQEWMKRGKKRARAKDDSESRKEELKMPEKFDGRDRNWKSKKRELIAYLNQKSA